MARITAAGEPTFDAVVREFDAITNEVTKAASNSFMLFWVSPDSATRSAGLTAFQRLDALSTALTSNRQIYTPAVDVDRLAAAAPDPQVHGHGDAS